VATLPHPQHGPSLLTIQHRHPIQSSTLIEVLFVKLDSPLQKILPYQRATLRVSVPSHPGWTAFWGYIGTETSRGGGTRDYLLLKWVGLYYKILSLARLHTPREVSGHYVRQVENNNHHHHHHRRRMLAGKQMPVPLNLSFAAHLPRRPAFISGCGILPLRLMETALNSLLRPTRQLHRRCPLLPTQLRSSQMVFRTPFKTYFACSRDN